MRTTVRLLPVALAGQIVCAAHVAAAQASIVIESPRRDTLAAEGDGVITAAFDVRNRGTVPAHAVPKVDVPPGWSVVVGNSSFALDAGARELWFVGVAPSATTPAGTYPIRVRLFVAGVAAVTDTLNVRVPERRGLELFPGDAPLFAMAGDGYPVSFVVRNRGNVTATVSLQATTSVGAPPRLQPASVTIPAGASATIRGRVSNDPAVAGMEHARECHRARCPRRRRQLRCELGLTPNDDRSTLARLAHEPHDRTGATDRAFRRREFGRLARAARR